MIPLRVALLAPDALHLNFLQGRIGHTTAAEIVFTDGSLSVPPGEALLRALERTSPDAVMIAISPEGVQAGARTVQVLHEWNPALPLITVGAMSNPAVIVDLMRYGACDFLDRDGEPGSFVEAFSRVSSARQNRSASALERGVICAIFGGKGGDGTTTVATNTAVALQALAGGVALVDMGPLGHTALQLDLRANFGFRDAIENLHRLDGALLQAIMMSCPGGLNVLAGQTRISDEPVNPRNVATLLQRLAEHYRYLVVDCSGPLTLVGRAVAAVSSIVLVVAQPDNVSLWGASRTKAFFAEEIDTARMRIVLNRCRKNQAVGDQQVETTTGSQLFWKVPNDFHTLGPSLDRGVPPVRDGNTELARSFRGLAAELKRWKWPATADVPQEVRLQPKSKLLERLIEVTTPTN